MSEIEARVDEKVLPLKQDVEKGHLGVLAAARRKGERLGTLNLPAVDQAGPSAEEQLIASTYGEALGKVESAITPAMKRIKTEAVETERVLNRPAEVDQRETADSTKRLQEETTEQTRVVDEQRTRRIALLVEHFTNAAQVPFNRVKDRLHAVQETLGRQHLDAWPRSRWVYLGLLALIGVCEFPLNRFVFQVLGESKWATDLMAGTLVLAIPLAAHFAGVALKRRKARESRLLNLGVVVGASTAIVTLSYLIAILRVQYIENTTSLSPDSANASLFVLLSVLLFGIGTLLAYGHHDESVELEASWRDYLRAEKMYQAQNATFVAERRAADESHAARCDEINADLVTKTTKIRNRKAALALSYRENIAYYNTMLAALKALEHTITEQYQQAIQTFRTANITARWNQAEPVAFGANPEPLVLPSAQLRDLEPPEHIVRSPIVMSYPEMDRQSSVLGNQLEITTTGGAA
jgi:hypothetical protein